MPQPAPFIEDVAPTSPEVAPSGMRNVGDLSLKSRRARWEKGLIIFPLISMLALSDGIDTRSGPVDQSKLLTLVVVYLGLGALCVALPLLFFRNDHLTFTIERPDQTPFQIKTTFKEIAKRFQGQSAIVQGSFRPQVIDDQRIQIELRSNWKGKSGWMLFVPEQVAEGDLEDHLNRYLPCLAKTLILHTA